MNFRSTITKSGLSALSSFAGKIPFTLQYWDGETTLFGNGDPQFTILLNDATVVPELLYDPQMAFCEAYMDGRIDIEGDFADIVSATIFAMQDADAMASGPLKNWAMRNASRVMGKRSKKQQAKDVSSHYDLGNSFYRLWLDKSLTYSCAYFHDRTDSLESAQQQKIDHVLKKLRLKPHETLLDIGSGWGALVIRAAQEHQVTAVGITLSHEQLEGSCAEISSQGLGESVDVRLLHYEGLVKGKVTFDKISSVGMIEHVGKAHLGEFYRSVAALLKPGGLALLHNITTPKEGPFNEWMGKYIFPGAYLPTVPEVLQHCAENDLRTVDVENLRPHYQYTLDEWSKRFEAVVPEITARYGEKFVRMWRIYLRSSSACFREGNVEIHQFLVSKGKSDLVPLTRADLY